MSLIVLKEAKDIKTDDLKDRQSAVSRVLSLDMTRLVLEDCKTLQMLTYDRQLPDEDDV